MKHGKPQTEDGKIQVNDAFLCLGIMKHGQPCGNTIDKKYSLMVIDWVGKTQGLSVQLLVIALCYPSFLLHMRQNPF
jgi:hypothetical protein